MTKAQLVEKIAEQSRLTKTDAESALNAFINVVTEALKEGDNVTLVGFGAFKVTEKKARTGRNPKTNEPVEIPACKAPKFTAGKNLKDAVNGK
ncbi:MAG: HU family DNA-binding protein [Ruminobacter sp.]|nr:HU family DNA-binding protein [Ruminobacter sp.]